MSAPVAFVDANVWYSVPVRDLIMQLAVSRLLRPRWTRQINDEWTRNLLANRPDIPERQVDFTKAMMIKVVPDGIIRGFESLIDGLALPDADDRHVLAAAIHAEADVIVTFNRRDFPIESTRPYDIEVQHPDTFFGMLIELEPEAMLSAAHQCRARLARPALSADHYVRVFERQKLPATARFFMTILGSYEAAVSALTSDDSVLGVFARRSPRSRAGLRRSFKRSRPRRGGSGHHRKSSSMLQISATKASLATCWR